MNQSAVRQTARTMLLEAKGKSVNHEECPKSRRSVGEIPTKKLSNSIEPPLLEGGILNNRTDHKRLSEPELKFTRIVIAKTTTINMRKYSFPK